MGITKISISSMSAWTMVIFGGIALILGLLGLIQPEITLIVLNFPLSSARQADDFTLTFLTASSMASFNMGVYYILAALSNWKPFFRWTVPFRILTFCIFTLAVVRGIAPVGFIAVAVWELVGALLTGAALWFERRQDNSAISN